MDKWKLFEIIYKKMSLFRETQKEIDLATQELALVQSKLERLREEERKFREELLELKRYVREVPQDD